MELEIGIPIQALIFLLAIAIVLVGPLIVDQFIQYRFTKRKLEKITEFGKGDKNIYDVTKPTPTPGLYRSLMTFGVILLVGAMLMYVISILASYVQPLNVTVESFKNASIDGNNSTVILDIIQKHIATTDAMSQTMLTIIKDVATILGGAVSAIIGFYFGNKAATDSVPEKPTPSIEKNSDTSTTDKSTGDTSTTDKSTGDTSTTDKSTV